MFDVVRVRVALFFWCVPPQPMPPHSLSLNTPGRGNERGRLRARGFINLTSQSMPRIARSLLFPFTLGVPSSWHPLARACALGDSRTPNLELGEPNTGSLILERWLASPLSTIGERRRRRVCKLGRLAGRGTSHSRCTLQCSHDGGGYSGRLPRRIDNGQQRRARNSLFTSLLRLSLKPRGL